MQSPEPTKGHRWLQQLIGEWEFEMPVPKEGEETPGCMPGKEVVRGVGDLWIIGESKGAMPDGNEAHMVITLGFDPATGRFVGSWVGSMMNHLWVYDGELSADEKTLVLYSTGPDFADPTKKGNYKDVIELLPDGRRRFSGHFQAADGSWSQMMEMFHKRV